MGGIGAIYVLYLFLFGPLFVYSPVKFGYGRISELNLVLYYPLSREVDAQTMFKRMKDAGKTNLNFYGTTKKVPLILAPSDWDLIRFGSLPYSNISQTPYAILVKDVTVTTNRLIHEMSHANLTFNLGKSAILAVPRWFDEGLASNMAGQTYCVDTTELSREMATSKYFDEVYEMSGIGGYLRWNYLAFYDSDSKYIFGQSYLMVKYLADNFGRNKIQKLITNLKEDNFASAFEKTYNMSLREFKNDFREFVNQRQES